MNHHDYVNIDQDGVERYQMEPDFVIDHFDEEDEEPVIEYDPGMEYDSEFDEEWFKELDKAIEEYLAKHRDAALWDVVI